MRLLRLLHVYSGLVLCALMFVLAISGGALVYKEAWWRLTYEDLDRSAPVADPAAQAAAIAQAWSRFGPELRNVKMPEPGVPAYRMYLEAGEAFLSPEGEWIDEWATGDRLMSWLFDLHAHLMAGERGELVGGVIALAGVMMVLSGLVLWLPARGMYSIRNLWPRGLSRRHLLAWHRDSGLLLTPLLLLLLVSGAGLVFYAQAQKLLNGLFGDAVPVLAAPPVLAPDAGQAVNAFLGRPDMRPRLPDAQVMERVSEYFPGARVVLWYPEENGTYSFRVKQDCELHPNGRTYLYVNAHSGSIVHAVDACAQPPGERLLHTFYPLHAAKTGHAWYRALAFLGALVLAGLSVSGVITYLQKLLRKAPVKR